MNRNVFHPNRLASALGALLLTSGLLLTGCTADFAGTQSGLAGEAASAGAKLAGNVHGGQQPVYQSTVQLWAAGTSGYGSAATAVGAAVTTDTNGGFTLGSYTCPSGGYMYITAAGGNPQLTGSSSNNPALAMVAVLGTCTQLAATPFITINEVTTAAAMTALAPFASVNYGTALSSTTTTPSDSFGTSSTNLQGLATAMNTAQILASTATGTSPGTGAPGFPLSANVTNIEYWQVNTFADILALCVNSLSLSSSTCSPVMTTITSASSTTNPADTLQMAYFFAKNPGVVSYSTTSNGTTTTTSLLSQVTATAPFQPYDATLNDFTIGYNVTTGTLDSRWIAFDASGNAWVTTSGAGIFEFSPTGTVIPTPTTYTPSGGSSTAIATSYEVAVDTAGNAWFTDETKPAIFEVYGSTTPGGANGGAGTAVSTSSVSTGLLEGIAVDGSNNVWASITSSHVVGLLNGAYTTLVTGVATTSSPFGMAVDMSNQSKFGNTGVSGGGSFVYALDSGGCSTNITANGVAAGGGSIAMAFTTPSSITTSGTTTNYTAGQATPLNYIDDASCNAGTNIPTNTTYSTPRNFMSTPYGIAFDNNNAMWVVNAGYTSTTDTSSGHYSVSKMAPQNYGADLAATPAVPFTGAGVGPTVTFSNFSGTTVGLNAPYYLAMDGAGAAWVGNASGAPLSAFTNSGGAISPASGLSGGTCTSSPCSTSKRGYGTPRGVAVDLSGNVWEANTAATYVTVLAGAATPTVVPLALGIKNGTLASRP